jgi:hypothetical protein
MYCFHEDGDTEQVLSDEVAEDIVVIPGNKKYFGAGPCKSHQFGDHTHVHVTEPGFGLHALEINDVSNEVDSFGFYSGKKIEEF